MQLTPHLVRAADLVRTFETFEPHAVPTPDGGWTIGYGHTRTAREGAQVDRVDGAALLIYDLIQSDALIEREVRVALTDNQRAALTAFAFNVGAQVFVKGVVVDRLNAGDPDGALREMAQWRRADLSGAVTEALVQRRAAERLRFLTPPQGFEQSSTPLAPPQRDSAPDPRHDEDVLNADAGEPPPPPVMETTAAPFVPLRPAGETEGFTTPQKDGAGLAGEPMDLIGSRMTNGSRPRVLTRLGLASAPRRIVPFALGALGLVLFVLAVAMILGGRLGGLDLAIGLAGVLLMIPAIYMLLGRLRRAQTPHPCSKDSQAFAANEKAARRTGRPPSS